MEQWEKYLKKRIVSSLFMAAVGTLNYILVTFLILLSIQAQLPSPIFIFFAVYIIALLAATVSVYKLINACRIDLSRGTTQAEYCEIVSVYKSRLVVKIKDQEKALYLPKDLRNDKRLEPGKKLHITFLQRSKTVIKYN